MFYKIPNGESFLRKLLIKDSALDFSFAAAVYVVLVISAVPVAIVTAWLLSLLPFWSLILIMVCTYTKVMC